MSHFAAPSVEQLRQHARACLQEQRLPEAQAALEVLLARVPDDTAALLQLSDVLYGQGRMQASTLPLLRAAGHPPRNAPMVVSMAQELIARGEILAARECLDFLASAPNPPSDVLLAQAHLRSFLGEIPVATGLIEKAMRSGADDPDDHHLYANLLQFSGDIGKAAEVLQASLKRWPNFGDAALLLASLRKQRPEANQLPQLNEQLAKLPAGDVGPGEAFVRAEFEYALFKTLDDLGSHDDAWEALERCNALMRQLTPYDPGPVEATVSALIAMPPPATPVGLRPEGPIPIFVVGMARSGTTLLERMLSSHSMIASAGELVDFRRQLHWVADVCPAGSGGLLKVIQRSAMVDFRAVGARYLRQTQWRAQNCPYYIDKLPANVQLVSFIRQALPHAPILHMVRDSMDTCFSNYKAMFGSFMPYSYGLNTVAHYYRHYKRLVNHWHAALPGAMLDVPYASLVQHPEDTMRMVLAHCGLGVEEACLRPERNVAPVTTPSSVQVREAIHTRGLEQWRKYERQLEPLRFALGVLAG